MGQRVTDGNLYRVYTDNDNHINKKVNEYGRKSAIQFSNEGNKLKGPVELEKVNVDEILEENMPRKENSIKDIIISEVVGPCVRHFVELGTDKLISYLSEKGIPKLKQVIKEYRGVLGQETTASKILRQTNENRLIELEANEEFEKHSLEMRKQENIEQVSFSSEEENKKFLDGDSYHIILDCNQSFILVDGEKVPVTNFISYSEKI